MQKWGLGGAWGLFLTGKQENVKQENVKTWARVAGDLFLTGKQENLEQENVKVGARVAGDLFLTGKQENVKTWARVAGGLNRKIKGRLLKPIKYNNFENQTNENMKKFDLEDRLIDFANMVINVVETLPNEKAANHRGNQLVRSGTAPALIYGEAQAAESNADFIHKAKLVLKELRET